MGVSINVLFLLYSSARPTVHVDKYKVIFLRRTPASLQTVPGSRRLMQIFHDLLQSEWGYEYIVITPDRSLAFPSVEYLRKVVSKAGVKHGYSSIPVVIDSRHVHGADFTAAKVQ